MNLDFEYNDSYGDDDLVDKYQYIDSYYKRSSYLYAFENNSPDVLCSKSMLKLINDSRSLSVENIKNAFIPMKTDSKSAHRMYDSSPAMKMLVAEYNEQWYFVISNMIFIEKKYQEFINQYGSIIDRSSSDVNLYSRISYAFKDTLNGETVFSISTKFFLQKYLIVLIGKNIPSYRTILLNKKKECINDLLKLGELFDPLNPRCLVDSCGISNKTFEENINDFADELIKDL